MISSSKNQQILKGSAIAIFIIIAGWTVVWVSTFPFFSHLKSFISIFALAIFATFPVWISSETDKQYVQYRSFFWGGIIGTGSLLCLMLIMGKLYSEFASGILFLLGAQGLGCILFRVVIQRGEP